ncbi:MAG: DUF4149 domain-containing protein [Hylemonella sp.]|uniref:DUF4149 domain-containing protein n=1 Tax=Hylemonella sp. TaxID=2066020 RepID=UPI0022C2E760|nr:DUF4149 domain-containing protein [Hylemonella sp.]MCZ8251576.1 DUF4149 domain-containing protein [Hylemonella sp.]
MRAFLLKLPLWAAALWWGSLTTVGFLVVPLLFVHLPSPALAGGMAAKLFTAQTWITVVCTLLLLMASRPEAEEGAERGPLQAVRLTVVGGLLLALLVEFAVAPRILARDNLALWHRAGSTLYVLQWFCAAITFWRLGRGR